MNLQELTAQFQEEIKTLRKAYMEKAQQAFTEMTMNFFEKYPEIAAIRWEQGTPGFCDGDPCYFYAREAQVMFTEEACDKYDLDPFESYGEYNDMCQHIEDGTETLMGSRWDTETHQYAYDVPYKSTKWKTICPIDYQEELMKDLAAVTALDNEFFESAFGDGVRVTITREGTTEVEETCFDC